MIFMHQFERVCLDLSEILRIFSFIFWSIYIAMIEKDNW